MRELKTHTERVRQRLNHWFQVWVTAYPEFPFDAKLISWLNQVVVAGKLLRGSLTLGWYQALTNSRVPQSLVDMAVVIELAETGLLIHDDLIDQDELRRGLPSTHKKFAELAKDQGWRDSAVTGLAAGICAGDILFFWLTSLIDQVNLPAEIKSHLTQLAMRELALVVFAEFQDVTLSQQNASATYAQIVRLHQRKTGRYSFVWPLKVGAIVAGISDKKVALLDSVGEQLGVLYQYIDDRLGLLGDWQQTGKGIRSDIAQSKQTLYRHYLFSKSTSADQQILNQIFGNDRVNEQDIEWVRQQVNHLGIDQLVENDIKRQAQLVLNTANSPTLRWLPPKAKQFLLSLTDYLLKRQA